MEREVTETHPAVSTRLPQEVVKKAAALGITEEQLCHRLGISHSHFSRWKRGLRLPPDPRDRDRKEFYVRLAKFLDKSLAEVLAEVLFLDDREEAELRNCIFDSLDSARKELALPSISADAEEKLKHILLNLPGREEAVTILYSSLQSYVRDVRHEKWFEDPKEAGLHLRNTQKPVAAAALVPSQAAPEQTV